MNSQDSFKQEMPRSMRGSGLICGLLILLLPALTGCKTFNYSAADLERERRQMKDSLDTPFGDKHGYGGDFGSIHVNPGQIHLPDGAFGKGK